MAAGALSFVTLNLWGENGPVARRMALVEAELARLDADVIGLQEVRVSPVVGHQAERLAAARGYQVAFAPATAWGGGEEGLAVLSRFPITGWSSERLPHATEQEGRILLSAQISSPHGELWVHVTHLSYREHEGDRREDQVRLIEGVMTSKVAPVPAGAPNPNPHVLMGDFNAPPTGDEIRWLCGQTSLGGRRVFYQDAWDTLRPHDPGYTWARENPFRARMGWLRADRRLDYVFVSAPRRDGRGQILEVARAFDRPDVDGVYPSDHYGVLARVQMTPLPPSL